jgi:AcrR family transcriptional regulator
LPRRAIDAEPALATSRRLRSRARRRRESEAQDKSSPSVAVGRRGRRRASTEPAQTSSRARLIDRAAAVFRAKGYEQASLRQIAAAAGILPGSVYHHFRSKEELFATVHAEGFRRVIATVDRALEGQTDPWCRLEAAIAAHIESLVGSDDVSVVTATSLFHFARPALQRRLNRERDAYEDRLRLLIADLDLPLGVDRTLLRLALIGALNWMRVWYRPDGRASVAEITHHLVHQILRRNLDASSNR